LGEELMVKVVRDGKVMEVPRRDVATSPVLLIGEGVRLARKLKTIVRKIK
jgi:hypothetical protein